MLNIKKTKKHLGSELRINVLSKSVFVLLIILILQTSTYCDKNKFVNDQNTANLISVVDVCELISAADVAKIFEIKISESNNTVQMGNEDRFVSQCSYTSDDKMQYVISIMLRYAKNETVPQNEEEFIAISGLGDEETKKEIEKAVKNGKRLTDLEGFAIWYQFYEGIPTLSVYYDHYEIVLNASQFSYDESTMNKAKSLVKLLMNKLNK